jgi:hypothetical protein
LIRRHLWAGVVLVILVMGAGLLSIFPAIRSSYRWGGMYLSLTLLANGLVVYTGHLGGSLTHGENFLADAFPGWGYERTTVETRPREELLVFHDLVMPALEARCQTCHNPNRARGRLDMTSLQAMQRGGDSGRPMFVAERTDSSELFRRVTLPAGHEDQMPPDGRPGLSSDEIAILQWWIEEGASPDMRLGDGPPDLLRQTLMDRYLPRLVVAQRRRARDRQRRFALFGDLEREANRVGLVVEFDPDTDSTLFTLSMRFPPAFVNDQAMARLAPRAEAFSRLSLVGSDITDDGIRHLGGMRNLRSLVLQRTGIEGSGLAHLQSLPRLEVLNLSHTRVDDEGALNLLRMPALREVFLFGTAVSDSLMEALRTHLPDAQVLRTEGPFY